LSMAVPRNINVTNYSVEEGARKLQETGSAKDRILLLLSNPMDVLRLLQLGLKLSSVNVGGMHFSQGKQQILRNVSVDGKDIEAFKAIAALGVVLEGRVLPSDDMVNILDAIDKELKKEDAQGQ